MEWLPSSKKDGRRYRRNDEHVQIFRQIEETELDAGILRVVSCRQLRFGFWKVEWATVGLCVSCYQIDDERDERRKWSLEYVPRVCLSLNDRG